MHRLLLLCLIGYAVALNNPGIRAEVTPNGFAQLQDVIESMLIPALNASEPIPLNITFSQSILDGFVEFGNTSISQIKWDDITLTILPGVGLQLTITDLSFNMAYMISYALPFENPQTASPIAQVPISSLQIPLAITNNNGRPVITLTTPMSININPINWGVGGLLETVLDALSTVIDDLLDLVIPSNIQTAVQPIINAQLANFNPHIYLLPNQSIYLDLSMIGNPLFTPDLATFNIAGKIRTDKSDCPIVPNPFPEDNEEDVRIFVSESIGSCLIYSLFETDVLDHFVASFFPSKSPISYQFDADEGSDMNVSPAGIDANLNMTVRILRNQPKNETYITLVGFASLDVDLSFVTKDNKTYTLFTNISSLAFSRMGVQSYSEDMPEIYKNQIAQSNFTALSTQLDGFLNANVLPSLRTLLSNGTLLPSNYTKYLKEPKLEMLDGYLLLVTDLQL